MIQFWVNTPRLHKLDSPRYQPLSRDETPTWMEGDWRIELIQGVWGEHASPVQAHHPMRLANLHAEKAGATLEIPIPSDWVGLLYVLDGNAEINGEPITGRHLAIIQPGERTSMEIMCLDATRILMLTAAELHEPVFSHGPFVMNTIEEVQKAIFDYHDGKMGTLEE